MCNLYNALSLIYIKHLAKLTLTHLAARRIWCIYTKCNQVAYLVGDLVYSFKKFFETMPRSECRFVSPFIKLSA